MALSSRVKNIVFGGVLSGWMMCFQPHANAVSEKASHCAEVEVEYAYSNIIDGLTSMENLAMSPDFTTIFWRYNGDLVQLYNQLVQILRILELVNDFGWSAEFRQLLEQTRLLIETLRRGGLNPQVASEILRQIFFNIRTAAGLYLEHIRSLATTTIAASIAQQARVQLWYRLLDAIELMESTVCGTAAAGSATASGGALVVSPIIVGGVVVGGVVIIGGIIVHHFIVSEQIEDWSDETDFVLQLLTRVNDLARFYKKVLGIRTEVIYYKDAVVIYNKDTGEILRIIRHPDRDNHRPRFPRQAQELPPGVYPSSCQSGSAVPHQPSL